MALLIVSRAALSNEGVASIANGAPEQSTVSTEVARNMEQIAIMVESHTQASLESSAAARRMADLTHHLRESAAAFEA